MHPTATTRFFDVASIFGCLPIGPSLPANGSTSRCVQNSPSSGVARQRQDLNFTTARTNDVRRQQRLIDALEYGVVGVNGPLTHHPEASLGGWKDSGIDTEGGIEILDPYQTTKHVSLREARW